MCGIIGKVGAGNVFPELINGLKNLEYRGYDSAGVAGVIDNKILRFRQEGRISNLETEIQKAKPESFIGIGHTRWATHGSPTKENAHPHMSNDGKFALVHNGIIENAEELKKSFLDGKIKLASQTDTEIVVQLMELFYNGDVISAISETCKALTGSFAFGILCEDTPNTLYAVGQSSPLLIVKSKTGHFIASDFCAVGEEAEAVYRLTDGEICALTENDIKFFNPSGKSIEKYPEKAEFSCSAFDKGEYDHFMLKEIFEQPKAVEDTIKSFLKENEIVFPNVKLYDNYIKEKLDKIIIVACGSAYHAGLSGKGILEKLCKIPCSVEIASEFRYGETFINENTLGIFISQSGETADTLAALRLAKKKGAKILSIVNVTGSAIAEESENVIYTKAGREIAVATTKAYSAQLVSLYALALYMGKIKGSIEEEKYKNLIKEFKILPEKIEKTIKTFTPEMEELANKIYKKKAIFFIGRLNDFATAAEGSLKMKEISYINSQSYPAGELKHGTISLIEDGTIVVAVAGKSKVFSKTASNVSEVQARGADVILITDESEKDCKVTAEFTVTVPETLKEFQNSLLVLPLQLLSYYTAKNLGCDIDRPKNLAKSVTVE
ncbi:MAG: glutamine--fructose-6-phosphate transaminase (isomerizing) [Ruminococcaceae bacterium]|nr:glutamine--fructose-6-phosphate transaminase (isomerizing) [Oscillospiraceae bacterium]